jgi:tRNA nucleotidyltransferase/poly(A) polymerase
MKNILNTFFFKSNNLKYINLAFRNLKKKIEVTKIFDAINSFSKDSEVRYVGGCVRKIINKEEVDDIDLAVNLNPSEVCQCLKNNDIEYYESGILHGTVTAIINKHKFEITSLRQDVDTDGRHAKVEFSKNWKEDASRRDFTFNSIYADIDGNLFDPFDGKKDLENGKINFIGDADKRVKEDFLRVLRYVRFYLNYSKNKHDPEIIKIIKKNLIGLQKISSDRLLDEFKKLLNTNGFFRLFEDKECLEIINLSFPQLKNISVLKKLNSFAKQEFRKVDFVFLVSLMVIDGTDNADYFVYKFNISKKDQKRIIFLNNFFSKNITKKSFSEKNLNKIFYFNGVGAINDLLYFRIFKSNTVDPYLLQLIKNFNKKEVPIMPFKANFLMEKYNIPEGKELGGKLKLIEETWCDNNFQISDAEVQKIINN